jgi:hypothetical protein
LGRSTQITIGTERDPSGSYTGIDDDERDGTSGAAALRGLDPVEAEAIRAEGLDPDDPAVQMALDLVRWELELLRPGGE